MGGFGDGFGDGFGSGSDARSAPGPAPQTEDYSSGFGDSFGDGFGAGIPRSIPEGPPPPIPEYYGAGFGDSFGDGFGAGRISAEKGGATGLRLLEAISLGPRHIALRFNMVLVDNEARLDVQSYELTTEENGAPALSSVQDVGDNYQVLLVTASDMVLGWDYTVQVVGDVEGTLGSRSPSEREGADSRSMTRTSIGTRT